MCVKCQTSCGTTVANALRRVPGVIEAEASFAPGETLKTVEVILVYDKRCGCRSIFSTRGVTPRPPPTAANISRATRWESNISFKVHLRDPTGGAKLGPLGEAGLDEGLLSFSLPHFRLYGESL